MEEIVDLKNGVIESDVQNFCQDPSCAHDAAKGDHSPKKMQNTNTKGYPTPYCNLPSTSESFRNPNVSIGQANILDQQPLLIPATHNLSCDPRLTRNIQSQGSSQNSVNTNFNSIAGGIASMQTQGKF